MEIDDIEVLAEQEDQEVHQVLVAADLVAEDIALLAGAPLFVAGVALVEPDAVVERGDGKLLRDLRVVDEPL